MNGMTIKQIAEVCGVDTKTVRRWVDKMSTLVGQNVRTFSEIKQKMIVAGENGEPTVFTFEETLAIIRAGGRETLADLLQDNAQRVSGEIGETRIGMILPPASQIKELRLSAERGLIDRLQFQTALGFEPVELTGAGLPIHAPIPASIAARLSSLSYPVTSRTLAMAIGGTSYVSVIRWGRKLGYTAPFDRDQALAIVGVIHESKMKGPALLSSPEKGAN